ncbi:hypothetical protein P8452_19357 [Trifolium repens]|nr:hypothetical protein P8452_19357 [Trifolium repens]
MTTSRLSIPMADRISDLPDPILCHILSFLPTKQAATTCVLSKRWKPVWLSVLALDFDDKTFKKSVIAFAILFTQPCSHYEKKRLQSIHLPSNVADLLTSNKENTIKFLNLRCDEE